MGLLGVLLGSAHADFREAVSQYNAGSYETARTQFLALAELGDGASQFNLGAMAMQGQAGPKDPGSAVGWLTAAAENGDRHLTYAKLVEMRWRLTDGERKSADALVARYGSTALSKTVLPVPRPGTFCAGFVPAHAVGTPDLKYPKKDLDKLQSGFVILQLVIGVNGTASDPEVLMAVPATDFSAEAVGAWLHTRFEPARRAGVPIESELAVRSTFRGGPMWDADAFRKIHERAATGDTGAQYVIGRAATLDSSVRIAPVDAYHLLVSAAQGGHPRAQYWAASSFRQHEACEPADKKMPWLRAAAAGGEGAAQLALATELLKGEPSTEQLTQARALVEQAAQSDDFRVRKHVIALMAASPLEALRDPATARVVAKKLSKDAIQSDPQMFEALAAADAVNGDFWSAADQEQVAIRKAAGLHWNTQPMEDRLAAYHAARHWSGDLLAAP